MSYPRRYGDPWDARNPSGGRPILHPQPSGYGWQYQPGRPPLQPRTNTQQRAPFSRVSSGAPQRSYIPKYPIYNDELDAGGWDRTYPRGTHDEYINPPTSTYPKAWPHTTPRAGSRSASFAEPARTRGDEVWTLVRGQSTVTFEVVMQYPRSTPNLIIPSTLQMLQQRNGPKYCLGSAENEAKLRRYVLGQMRRIIKLHEEGGCHFGFADKVRVQFIPFGDDICGRGDNSSCERHCARRLLAADQLVARYEKIVRLPHRST